MKLRSILLILLVALIACCCSSDTTEAEEPSVLEFLVLDDTGTPVKNARIKLLESGRTKKTKGSGMAGFSEKDLAGSTIQSITDSVAYAFSIVHPNFRPREVNATIGVKTIRLMPDSTGTYIYQQPVQFDDDLPVGTLFDAGFDTAKIHQLMNKIAKPGYRDLHSILIYKDGKLVLEEYYYGNNDTIDFEGGVTRDKRPAKIWWNRNGKHYVASVNKALTSTLTGIALGQKGLTTDAYIKDYLPQYASYFNGNENKSLVKFHHALNMNLGFQWDEWASNDLKLMRQSDDFGKFLLSRNNANGPGKVWYYNSASPNLLLKCIENMVDQPVRQWAHENFYDKLGINDYKWQDQPGGYPEGAARMYLRPRDMLKIGVTYLNMGKWKDEQVIPQSWVEKCLVVQTTTSGLYSHMFWIRQLNGVQYLSADGDGGQFINIFPDQNMVIVITQGLYLEWPIYVNQANDMMGNYIFPALN